MTKRVDPETLLCVEHNAPGCTTCMLNDFRAALAEAFIKSKSAEPKPPVDERFDVGGEG